MKYIVYVTSYIKTRIDGGNYIGEGRWERNVLDALIKDNRDVYVVPHNNTGDYIPGQVRIWKSSEPKPTNLKDYYELKDIKNSIFIAHSPPNNLDIPVKAHRYILQWFNGPDNDVETKFLQLVDDNPNSVVATYNFLRAGTKIVKHFKPENVQHIEGPAIPTVTRTSNFNKPYLLWTSKVLYNWSQDHNKHFFLQQLFTWCSEVLKKDSKLRLAFLLGAAGPHITHEAVTKWFWNTKMSKPLFFFQNRVEFLHQIEWYKVHDILKETRLVITPHTGFGGPPYEAAAVGVPLIMSASGHPFQQVNGQPLFPEVLTITNDNQLIPYLNRLLTDKSFYNTTGNAYRNYVNINGSYKGYLNKLDSLCLKRGWLQ